MVLGKDHKERVFGKGGVHVALRKAFGKECVATQSSMMAPEEVATLKREITNDFLDKVPENESIPCGLGKYYCRGSANSTWGS